MGHIVNRSGRPDPVRIDRGPRPGASWYSITNRVVDAGDAKRKRCATVRLYDEIGMWGTTAGDFARELDALEDIDEIELLINSPGGDVFDGLTIYNTLVNHPATIRGRVDGLAASAASFIAMSCDDLEMGRGSMMMIHDAAGFALGNAGDMRSMADLLDKVSDQIAGIYAARTGIDAGTWRKRMLAETWFTDVEAVEAGLASRTAGTGDDEATDRASAWIKTKFTNVPTMPGTRIAATGDQVPAGGSDAHTAPDPVDDHPADPPEAAEPTTVDDAPEDVTAAACTCECDPCTDGDCASCTDRCDLCDEAECPCMDDEETDPDEDEPAEEEDPEDSTNDTPTDVAADPVSPAPAEEAPTAGVDASAVPDPDGPAPPDPFQDAMSALLAQTTAAPPGRGSTTPTADTWVDLVARLVGPPSSETADDVLARMREALP